MHKQAISMVIAFVEELVDILEVVVVGKLEEEVLGNTFIALVAVAVYKH